MSKHDTRTAYPARGLAAAEAALLTLWPALSPYHQDLVLVGRLAVHYLTRHGAASPWPGVVTMDVDFGIELSTDNGQYGSICTALEGLGFHPDPHTGPKSSKSTPSAASVSASAARTPRASLPLWTSTSSAFMPPFPD